MSAYCCIELDLLLTLNHDAGNHEFKILFSILALGYLKLLFTLLINLGVGLFVYRSVHAYTYVGSVCISKTLVSDPRSLTGFSHSAVTSKRISRQSKGVGRVA